MKNKKGLLIAVLVLSVILILIIFTWFISKLIHWFKDADIVPEDFDDYYNNEELNIFQNYNNYIKLRKAATANLI